MAVNPNFVYTNPVAAHQAVQMFQLQQASEDAMRRNAQENIRTFAQQNVARDNAAQQRAYTQSQIGQRDRELAQQQSQFNTTNDRLNRQTEINKTLTESDIAARRSVLGNVKEDEIFQALQNSVLSDNPPTELEFQAKTEGLQPHRKQILFDLRQQKITDLNRNADIAENIAKKWQMRLDALKPEDVVQRDSVLSLFEKSKDKNYLEFDPASNIFRSLLRRPRTDAILGPELPGASVTPIEDILKAVPQQPTMSFPGANSLIDAYRTIAPSWLGGRPNPMMPQVPTVDPAIANPVPVQPSTVPFNWESAVQSYLPQYPR